MLWLERLIITKTISRFARNTVDNLTAIRKLREKQVYVIFEEQGITTEDAQGEMLITMMSCIAQEESRNLSENVTWGKRQRMAKGKVDLPYGRFLGYEKGEDGLPKIVESEAKVVRLIYSLFLQGKTCGGIARQLTQQRIPTPAKDGNLWHAGTVKSILTNEKFKGCALLQKAYTTDFLTKKRKINEGEVEQYYVKNSHPGIVEPEVHDMVQAEFARRKGSTGAHTFSSKIICGSCGGFYNPKTWHSTDKYRRKIWRCGGKYEKGTHCPTPHLTDNQIKDAFVRAFNRMYAERPRVADDYEAVIAALTDTTELDRKAEEVKAELNRIKKENAALVDENTRVALNQADYCTRKNLINEQYEGYKLELESIEVERAERITKRERVTQFLAELEQSGPLSEFDEGAWYAAVEKVTVGADGEMMFAFRYGSVIKTL